MKIFPAIDISGGKAVRLAQGDYAKMKVYGDNPLEIARSFEADGAKYLHLVDLDGALSGDTVNFKTVEKIAGNTAFFIEIGGGIRDKARVERYLEAGANRVIIGTAAIENFKFTAAVVKKYKEKIAVGVDAKDGKVATRGWTNVTGTDAFEFCEKLRDIGVQTVVFTDISRDGMLSGANLEAYAGLSEIDGLNVVASGGITFIDEIKALSAAGVYGAILGKSLYENRLSLKDAIAAAEVV